MNWLLAILIITGQTSYINAGRTVIHVRSLYHGVYEPTRSEMSIY